MDCIEQTSRDVPQIFNIYQLPSASVSLPRFLSPVSGSVLSKDVATGAATLLVELPPNWSFGSSELGTAEIYVLDGALEIDGSVVGPGGFLAVPRAARNWQVGSRRGARAILFWNPEFEADFYYGDGPYISRPWEQPWNLAARPGETPLMPGAANASLYKSLRPCDDNTAPLRGGPNGFLRLFFFLPGYGFPRQDVHHQSWEEVIFLTGDCLMADRGILGPGSYVGNPRGMLHGPMASQTGCLMLIHNTAPQDFETYNDFPEADSLIEWYLQDASLCQQPSTTPWRETTAFAVWSERVVGKHVPSFPTYIEGSTKGQSS